MRWRTVDNADAPIPLLQNWNPEGEEMTTPADLRRFARRDWSTAATRKGEYWVEQYRLHGAAPARTASTALLLHMQTVQPDFPSRTYRDADLANHLLHRQRLDRAAHAFSGR